MTATHVPHSPPRLVEHPTPEVEVLLDATIPRAEERLVCVHADMDAAGLHFGDQWLVVTACRVVVVQRYDGDLEVVETPIEQILRVHVEALVGGGSLQIERRGAPTVRLSYTGTETDKFAEAARGLEQLRRQQPFVINGLIERVRCETCSRLLPEKNGVCPACIRKWSTLKRIIGYIAPYRVKAILLAIASVVTTMAELAPPLITRRIIDDVLVTDSPATMEEKIRLLGLLVLALLGFRVVSWAAEWVHGWNVAWLGAQATADIRSQLYRRLEMLSLQFYDKRKVGALMSRVTRDTGRLQDFLVDGLPYLMINGMMIFGILGFLLYMSWELTIYTLIPVPFIVTWSVVFWKRMRVFFRRWGETWSNLTDRVSEALSGIRVVKAFAQQEREITAFARLNRKITDIGVETSVNRTVFFATISFLTGFGVLGVWFFGGGEVVNEKMTLGTLLAFYSYMWMVYGPLEWFGQVNSWMSRAFAGAERIFEVIDTEPESYDDSSAQRLPRMAGHISFDQVTFGYDKSKPVLQELDMEVKAGEMIGLVGRSGVGKTTIVNLIARFYDVDQGVIRIDGIDLHRLNLRDLRRQIGIVLQEPVLFSGTIADNIGYGNPGAKLDEIIDAARLANAHNFIVAKPDGYESQVGEQGNGLSGGERQRVAIARAMLHDPRILILDEATSSVDVETEKQIQLAIRRMAQGRTTFAIAHRLSTLRDADRVIVLEDGCVVEQGTHEELMKRKGKFYDLIQLQEEASRIIAIAE